ncbi:MAG: FKBP-type peptidyl-prolyl cis-trans isomerase [Bacteroidota bacterium]
MKTFLPLLLLGVLLSVTACLSRDDDDVIGPDPNQAAIDREIIVDYVNNSGFSFEEDPSGLFYRIVAPGSAERPITSDSIQIRYRGELLDGTIFDQTENNMSVNFRLNNLIAGWQIGIPLIGRNGSIEMVIPSGLAYGAFGAGIIPPNAVIFFRVDLIDFGF